MYTITEKELIGLIKLLERLDVLPTDDIYRKVLDIIVTGEYTSEERDDLNKLREETEEAWRIENHMGILRLTEEGYTNGELVIKDLWSEGQDDPQEISLKHRSLLLNSTVFLVLDWGEEMVHIVKSPYSALNHGIKRKEKKMKLPF